MTEQKKHEIIDEAEIIQEKSQGNKGIPFNFGLAIVFAVAFGIALDNWLLGISLGFTMGIALGVAGEQKKKQ